VSSWHLFCRPKERFPSSAGLFRLHEGCILPFFRLFPGKKQYGLGRFIFLPQVLMSERTPEGKTKSGSAPEEPPIAIQADEGALARPPPRLPPRIQELAGRRHEDEDEDDGVELEDKEKQKGGAC